MFEVLSQSMHLLLIVGLALLVFGPKRLPELGKEFEKASVASGQLSRMMRSWWAQQPPWPNDQSVTKE